MLRFELKHLGDFNYRTDALNHVFGDTSQGSIGAGRAGLLAPGLVTMVLRLSAAAAFRHSVATVVLWKR